MIESFRRDLADSHADMGEYDIVDSLYAGHLREQIGAREQVGEQAGQQVTSLVSEDGGGALMNREPLAERQTEPPATIRSSRKVGRNDPCPCGSGKKYKKCCGIG